MTEPFHGSAQRFDRTPVAKMADESYRLTAVMGVSTAFLISALVVDAPTWVIAVLTCTQAVLLAWAIVWLCRRPEDTQDDAP